MKKIASKKLNKVQNWKYNKDIKNIKWQMERLLNGKCYYIEQESYQRNRKLH